MKILTIFLNIRCDIHYYPANFEFEIQLVYKEIKKTNYIMG